MKAAVGLLVAAVAGAKALGDCDPLVPERCVLPWPNNFWRRDNGLNISDDVFPKADYGRKFSPQDNGLNGLDGFSPIEPILMTWPGLGDATATSSGGVAGLRKGLTSLRNISSSLNPDSPTVLLDAETGERVAHWVAVDHHSDPLFGTKPTAYERLLMLWPAQRLEGGHRYIVAISGVVDGDAKPVAVSSAFGSLRDGTNSTDPDVNDRRQYFEHQVFAPLVSLGVSRKDLTLAWDFTVAQDATWTRSMVHMRDDAFSRIASNPGGVPAWKVTSVQNFPTGNIAKTVLGKMTVPWYLNQYASGLKVRLVRGGDGLPAFQKNEEVHFQVNIPRSLVENGTAGRAIYYGHGLFGNFQEIGDGYLEEESNKYGYVYGSVNWLGLCDEDVAYAGLMAGTDINDFQFIPDRLHQGMLDSLLFEYLLSDPNGLPSDPAFQGSTGKSVIDSDANPPCYYGNSCGGIMGSVHMALTTKVERGVLGVAGGPFSLLLPRSVDFDPLAVILRTGYPNPMDLMIMINAMQLRWNFLEPSGYMQAVSREPLPGTKAHRVMTHFGYGDAQVTPFGGELLARSIGSQRFADDTHLYDETLFGFDFVPGSATLTTGNLAMGFNFTSVPDSNVPYQDLPANKATDTHDKLRKSQVAREMNDLFYRTGEMKNICGGPCIVNA